jgi:hypothetical protein
MTVDDGPRRVRIARSGDNVSLKRVQRAIAASADGGQHRMSDAETIGNRVAASSASPNREASVSAWTIACAQCRHRGSTFESRHRAD